jgi:hypothetical protein
MMRLFKNVLYDESARKTFFFIDTQKMSTVQRLETWPQTLIWLYHRDQLEEFGKRCLTQSALEGWIAARKNFTCMERELYRQAWQNCYRRWQYSRCWQILGYTGFDPDKVAADVS